MSKSIYVAPTMEEAERDAAQLENFSSRILRSVGTAGAPIGMPMDKNGKVAKGYEHWANRQRDRDRRDDPGHAGLPPLRGTPEVVIERLKQTQEAGINHVFGNFGFAGLPHEKVDAVHRTLRHSRHAPLPGRPRYRRGLTAGTDQFA